MTEDLDPKKECCNNCYDPSNGDVTCGDPSCLCHHPLGINAGDETKAKAIFGQLPQN